MSSTSTDALRLPEIRISDLNIILSSLRASYMFANTRFVWVKINNIGVMNTPLKRSVLSDIWYFPTQVVFFHGNLDTDTKCSANRTVQQMVLLLGICIRYFQVL